MSEIEAPSLRRPWSFVIDAYRLAYVTVPKAACTTLQWLVADLSGEDLSGASALPHAAASRGQLVHQRRLWQHTRGLDAVPADRRAAMTRRSGWFTFAVVRDPRARLWSAWQSKLLLRLPRYVAAYQDEPWFPRVPTETAHVVEDFATFVRAYEAGAVGALMDDNHFRSQAEILAGVDVPELAIYDLSRLGDLMADIESHLATYGREMPDLARENTTPLPLTSAVLADGVQERIEHCYAADFERYGSLWPAGPRTRDAATWTRTAFDDVAMRIEMHERLGDLAKMARRAARR